MDKSTFSLTILCPEKDFFEGEVNEVVFYTPEGSIGIMPGHAPLFAAVSEGILEVLSDGQWKTAAVGQGFCEIDYYQAEFYLDTAEWADEIDINRAKEALDRAEHRLHNTISKQDYLRTQASMSRALARLKAVEAKTGRHIAVMK